MGARSLLTFVLVMAAAPLASRVSAAVLVDATLCARVLIDLAPQLAQANEEPTLFHPLEQQKKSRLHASRSLLFSLYDWMALGTGLHRRMNEGDVAGVCKTPEEASELRQQIAAVEAAGGEVRLTFFPTLDNGFYLDGSGRPILLLSAADHDREKIAHEFAHFSDWKLLRGQFEAQGITRKRAGVLADWLMSSARGTAWTERHAVTAQLDVRLKATVLPATDVASVLFFALYPLSEKLGDVKANWAYAAIYPSFRQGAATARSSPFVVASEVEIERTLQAMLKLTETVRSAYLRELDAEAANYQTQANKSFPAEARRYFEDQSEVYRAAADRIRKLSNTDFLEQNLHSSLAHGLDATLIDRMRALERASP